MLILNSIKEINECPAKNRVMSDEGCLKTSWNSEVFGMHRLYENVLRQITYAVFFILQTVRCA